MERLRALSRWIAPALAMLSLAAALLGQGGRWSDQLDVLNHFTPVWLAMAAAAWVLWVFANAVGRTAPALASLALLMTLIQMGPELWGHPAPRRAVAGAEQLRVLQFNLWGGNAEPRRTSEWILKQEPDVIVIEEALGKARPILADLQDRYPYVVTCRQPDPCPVVILARRAPIAAGGLIDSLHFPAVWATFQGQGGPFTVVGVHYAWPYPAGRQQVQAGRLARFLSRLPKQRLIVAGDFNSTPWSFAMRRQDRAFGIDRRTRALPSWPAARFTRYRIPFPLPVLPIDHVYAGPGWRATSVGRGPRLGSDHYPVLISLEASPAR